MCRITGFWDLNYKRTYPLQDTLVLMRDSLQHGGPDSAGDYINEEIALGLGHRRLSILDLSAAGQQPMFWEEWVIVFNGEIYNFAAIRQKLELEGYQFETGTDTEVILKAFKAWGKAMVQEFRGFFAFAIFNQQTESLTLCRDRIGVKPMFWYWKEGLFMFASELKAFHEHPQFDKTINQNTVSLYLQQGYIPYPHCIFQYAHKLPAGAYLELDKQQQIKIEKYWDVQDVYANSTVSTASEADLEEELEQVLTESFELRMVADVPVGAFLSGGIDSSTVTALLQKKQGRQLKTFTIGFHDKEYNEAKHAKAVAKHLGTDHYELYCTEQDFERVIPLLPELYDEPFGDSSGIPTYLVAKMAREHVTVSLSSDGGDEIFGGYTKYEVTQNFYPKIKQMPSFVRSIMKGVSSGIDPLWLERNSSNKNYQNRYKTNLSITDQRLVSYLGMIDIDTYLEGDIMTKVDRATMAVALEGRDPFLDHKVIEFAMKLPDDLKIKGKDTKYLLRKILYKHVPKELIERPKQGFSIPIQKWLLNSLKEPLLSIKNDQAFFNIFQLEGKEVRQIIDNFVGQKAYINPHFIWFLYTLHQWYNRWMK